MKRLTIPAFACAALALFCGCAAVGPYFTNRARDLGECFIAEVGYGVGLDAHVLLTELISVGAGGSFSRVSGVRHGVAYVGDNYHVGLPVWPFILIFVEGARSDWWATDSVQTGLPADVEGGGTRAPPGYVAKSVLFLNVATFYDMPCRRGYPRDAMAAYDIEIGATVVLLEFRVGFSIGQFVDFLLGWFGADIAGDDR